MTFLTTLGLRATRLSSDWIGRDRYERGSPGKGETQQSQEMMHQERLKEQEAKHSTQGLRPSTREKEAGQMPQKSREEKKRELEKKGK